MCIGVLPILYISGYQFSRMGNLEELRSWCLDTADSMGYDIKGTIIIANEGINFSLCGPSPELEEYYSALSKRANLVCSIRRSYATRIGFRRFLVKIKPEIVSYRCREATYRPLPYLSVEDFHRWMSMSSDDAGTPLCLVDVRNDFEYQMGTFSGAVNVSINSFGEFSRKMSRHLLKENSTVVTFCTGGIRCEKASHWFYSEGISAYQLDGGIIRYLEVFGQGFFQGTCFVFDGRITLDGSLSPTNPYYL
ncbi:MULTISPECIES: oxygen-dependent tRNA uridine(34) hydroxylase TrhO [Candidatus Ichthyocystis]|uniref:oxygen-dependent tRNA uridine(34) hydroxylase TrhO n=1 Tax=Candidatus Ichthyocystis TaxID=2929841 RepID=UPI00158543DA|nr:MULTISPECIES: rhodanese-like domain-containing protein [Ichthyocystis]